MRLIRTWIVLAALVGAPVLASDAWARQPQPPKEFVPVDEVPQGEQIPAINLVAAAYGFVWIAVLGYVWSLARRQKHVESELAALESRRK
jgi:CcmD family protein